MIGDLAMNDIVMLSVVLFFLLICFVCIVLYGRVVKLKQEIKKQNKRVDVYKQVGAYIEKINRAVTAFDSYDCREISHEMVEPVKTLVLSTLFGRTLSVYTLLVNGGVSPSEDKD